MCTNKVNVKVLSNCCKNVRILESFIKLLMEYECSMKSFMNISDYLI